MDQLATTNNSTLAVDDTDFIGGLTSRSTMFCSLNADTVEGKAKLFNAMNNPDKHLKDCINEVIVAQDLFCETVTLTKKSTDGSDVLDEHGNPITSVCPRIVIIDTEGEAYQCVSMGIYNAFKKLITIFGPPTWSEGIPLKVRQINKGTRNILTLEVAG